MGVLLPSARGFTVVPSELLVAGKGQEEQAEKVKWLGRKVGPTFAYIPPFITQSQDDS